MRSCARPGRCGACGASPTSLLQDRLVGVVHALQRDIDAGNARECQAAVAELSESFLELEESDVPASYVARLRQEQAGLRKGVLRVTTSNARSSCPLPTP